jgi:hypothetical protein
VKSESVAENDMGFMDKRSVSRGDVGAVELIAEGSQRADSTVVYARASGYFGKLLLG